MTAVYVLTTGGTIEKVYSEKNGGVQNVEGVENRIDRYLRLLRLPDIEVNVVPLMNKDSLEMTDQDRMLILGMVRAILKERAPMVITHGTDTMVATGIYLQRALESPAVPIVLTGAMTPLGFERSDGLQNLTESLLAVQLLRPGIYIVMHGSVFPADQARKDHAQARFVRKSAEALDCEDDRTIES
jgi:L-asparaginase